MDINGSLAFVAVVDCGSFAAAARELGVPRSTVSARVAALEARLGVRLLRRSTRRISLTDEGEAWHASVSGAIAILRDAEHRGLTRGATLSGTIRLSVPLDFPDTVLADAIAVFLDNHPRVRVEVHASNDVVDFVGDKFDIAIRGGKPGGNDAVARRIGSFRMAAFASPTWLASCGDGDRADHTVTVPDSFAQLDSLAFSPCATAAQARVVANSFGLLKQMAIRGKGAATLPAHLCADALAAGTLVEIHPPQQDAAQRGLYLVYPSRGDMSARARAFAQHLGDALERIAVAAQAPAEHGVGLQTGN